MFDIANFPTLARVGAVLLPVTVAGFLASVSPPATGGATVSYASTACSSFTLSGTPPNQTMTCVTSGGGSTPVCAPTAKPSSPAVGQSTSISANCSGDPTSYVWTGGACAYVTASTCTVAKSKVISVTYTVQAASAAGMGSSAQITVSWH